MAKTDKNIDGKVIARIVRLREMKGLTQRELANRADMQHGYVARIEQGEVNPTLQTLGRIARGIGVPLVSLFAVDSDSDAMSKRELKALIDALPEEMVEKAGHILQILGR